MDWWRELTALVVVGGLLWLAIDFARCRVPYWPTKSSRGKKMIELAQLRPGQLVADLGAGDGRLVRAAWKEGAAADGYEISWGVWFLGKIINTVTRSKVGWYWKNFLKEDLSSYDVIFVYLLDKTMSELYRQKWDELKPGCQIISHTFPFREIKPQQTILVAGGKVFCYQKPKL